jgi:hypothetical protein
MHKNGKLNQFCERVVESGNTLARRLGVAALIVLGFAMVFMSTCTLLLSIVLIVSSLFSRLISVLAAYCYKVVILSFLHPVSVTLFEAKVFTYKELLPDMTSTPLPGVPRFFLHT